MPEEDDGLDEGADVGQQDDGEGQLDLRQRDADEPGKHKEVAVEEAGQALDALVLA